MIMNWKNKIANHHQIGGIETFIIDNGAGKGSRIAWINTGGGLRFKVLIDRAMDIGEASLRQYNLSWLSHKGTALSPASAMPSPNRWLDLFGGGLLTTCGLTHIGKAETDIYGERELNGSIGFQPAEIISVIQPDLTQDKPEMKLIGLIKESTPFGYQLELKRTISCKLGENSIQIEDIVTNTGNTVTPHMLLYHCNFGWPLVDEEAEIYWNGTVESRGLPADDLLFKTGDFRHFRKPVEPNEKEGDACGFIDAIPDKDGLCRCGIINRKIGTAVQISYNPLQLPQLTNWQRWIKNEYAVAIEPGTNTPSGQAKARNDRQLIFLAPGESKRYQLQIEGITGNDENL